jgi:hypothetical protein
MSPDAVVCVGGFGPTNKVRKLSTTTYPLPFGEEETTAVGDAGQLSVSVVLSNVTNEDNVALPFELATLTGSNSRIAPNAPVSGTLAVVLPFPPPTPVVYVTFKVALSKVPAGAEGVNVTLTVQYPGAEIVPEHVFVCAKSVVPVIETLATVRVFPLPLTLMFTASGALIVVPIGTPKERLPGDTVTL